MSSLKRVVIIIICLIIILSVVLVFNVEDKTKNKEKSLNTTQEYKEKDWKSMKFKLNKDIISINNSYKSLEKINWYINFDKMGYKNGYKLNANSKTMMSLKLNNKYYYDLEVLVGLSNNSDKKIEATKCTIWAIYVNNYNKKTPIAFTLPNNVTNGSNIENIKKAYGNPNSIIKEKNHDIYVYQHDYKIQLKLFVYDDIGLQAFEYKNY